MLKIRPVVLAVSTLCLGYVFAQEKDIQKEVNLSEVKVVAEKEKESAGTVLYSKEDIQATPGGNGDIQSLLIRHPNVSFDNSQLDSNTAGDIDPAKISINGARFYDNQFTLDGASIKSNISGGVNSDTSMNAGVPADSSQGLAIDTKLLCVIEVLDSNVSAQYGQFMGGVVNAQVCAPTKKFGGDISYEYTASKWMDKKIEKGFDNQYSTDSRKQDNFTKKTIRGSFESKVNDNLGIVGSYSKKESIIPLRAYAKGFLSEGDALEKNHINEIENFYLKVFSKPISGLSFDTSIMHSPGVISGFHEDVKDSQYESTHGGTVFNTSLKFKSDSGFVFDNQFSYKKTESSRNTEFDNLYNWKYSAADKNWGRPSSATARWSKEGGMGDIQQEEVAKSYNWSLAFPDAEIGSATNKFKIGGSLTNESYEYARLGESYYYTAILSTNTCTRTDGSIDELCSVSPVSGNAASANNKGQFLSSRNGYIAGSFKHQSNYRAFFLEDEIQWDRLRLRLGLRWDSSSDAGKNAVAPRFMAAYEFGQYRDILLEAGVNRYYGQNLKNYFIAQYKDKLRINVHNRTGINNPWKQMNPNDPKLVSNDINLPYVDEGMFALTKKFENYSLGFKYVHRNSRDEVVLVKDKINNINVTYPDNLGSSKTKNLSITLSTLKPLSLGSSKTNFSAIWDYQKRKATHSDWSSFDGDYNADFNPNYALFNGGLISIDDLPPGNFNRPWTLRFMTSTDFPRWDMRVDGFLRIRQAYKTLDITKTGIVTPVGKVSQYEVYKIPKSVTFDLRVTKNWKLSKYQNIYAIVTVENLFNRTNRSGFDSDSLVYLNEKGRQATVKVGYEF